MVRILSFDTSRFSDVNQVYQQENQGMDVVSFECQAGIKVIQIKSSSQWSINVMWKGFLNGMVFPKLP